MTDSLPPGQQRPPDEGEGETAGWDAVVPASHEPPGPPHGEDHDEQPGFPDGPTGPAEGGD